MIEELKSQGWQDSPPANATDGHKCEGILSDGRYCAITKFGEHGNSWHEIGTHKKVKVILWREY